MNNDSVFIDDAINLFVATVQMAIDDALDVFYDKTGKAISEVDVYLDEVYLPDGKVIWYVTDIACKVP